MKSAPFEYIRAESIGAACEVLRREGDAVKLIAGGQSLVPIMAMRLVRPGILLDINEIAALKFVASESDGVRIGACTRQAIVERDDALASSVPLLRQALAWVGHAQTRNRGTLGGSLVHADPCAELPLVAQLLGAKMVLRSTDGTRSVQADEFFSGPMMTVTDPGECLEEVVWQVWHERRTGSAFTEIANRHGDFAMVSAAAQIALDDDGRCLRAVFGLGGVGQTPLAFPKIAAQLVGTRLEDLQEMSRDVRQTAMAGYLRMPYSYLSMTKRSTYVDKLDPDHPDKRRFVTPFHSKYLFVYPFVKTTEWYQLPFDRRQAMMDEHIVLGNKYKSVRIHTTYSFGLDDPEFVLAFETDEPKDFLDLVMEMRESKARPYTLRDTPIFTCVAKPVADLLTDLGC